MSIKLTGLALLVIVMLNPMICAGAETKIKIISEDNAPGEHAAVRAFPQMQDPDGSLGYSEESGKNPKNEVSGRNLFRDVGNAGKIYLQDTWYFVKAPLRINKESAVWLGGIALGAGLIYAYDQEISDAFRRNREAKVYDSFLQLGYRLEPVGHMGVTNKYYFAGLGIGYIFKIKKLELISAQILESHLIGGGFKNLANILIGRRRPHEGFGPRKFEFDGGTSFPSGHASNIFQVATILSYHVNFWPFTVFAYTAATSVAVQRIDSRNHWPSDTFIAAIYGTVVSRAILRLHEQRKMQLIPKYNKTTGSLSMQFSLILY